jgi:(1->4)-alpha-D-glucan 1-alpha-D-glucosylmutase
MTRPLERLAASHGIGLEYHDIWGKAHRTSAAALVDLLAAMGIRADSPAAIDASLRDTEAARWRTIMPPAIVVRSGEPAWHVRLNLTAALDDATLAWRIVEESGATHERSFAPPTLSQLERATNDGVAFVARQLALPSHLPVGYHRFAILRDRATVAEATFVVAPRSCYRPPALENNGRVWGVTAQLYGVRSERNWGIGDYTDLRTLIEGLGARSGGIVGVNPVHALFPHDPERASPYGPSSRQFRNVLYLDVEAIDDYRICEEARALVRSAVFQRRLRALRDTPLVDYAGVAAAKFQVLELLYAHFRARHLGRSTARAAAFRNFQSLGGEALRRHALFEALQEHLHRQDAAIWGWPVWPAPYRDPASPDVEKFETDHADRIEFYEYLQWQADVQFGAAGRRSFELGLGVGIYEDLAISVDRSGAESWANQSLYALGASIGAPPDELALKGQNWGLPPWIPERLQAVAYAPFIAVLRANMKHSGALRIDHVMGLMRLFWVPPDGDARHGAYVHYPFADLLGLIALESQRNHCLVIGEDLGTVPDQVRAALTADGVLSYRLLYFERTHTGDFRAPAEYPKQALVTASTHDLPTLAGWWEGRDIALRTELGLFPSPEMREAQMAGRTQDRTRLLHALEREELLPGPAASAAALPKMTSDLAHATAVYLARTPSQVMVIQLEDVIGMQDQVNLPGTVAEHPNWRRKLPLTLDQLADDERVVELARTLARLRGRPRAAPPPRESMASARIPRATYRVQLHRDFTFEHATALADYFAALGVSHVYCSPYLRARPGSRHGYDIIDHAALNPEIGNRDDFERLIAALKSHGLGQIVDFVPNHMGIMGADNAWWMDVLENGQASVYADYFDIDWAPVDPDLAGKVLLPLLGDHYGNVLSSGELRLAYEPQTGAFAVWYYEHRVPIDPREYAGLLARAVRLVDVSSLSAEIAADFQNLIAAFSHLPPRSETSPEAVAERARAKEAHKSRLAHLANEHPVIAEAIERAVAEINTSESFNALHELLEAQAYRLAYWRVAADEINYRRFFDINDLAALRMENAQVFEATHRFVLELAAEGKLDGLRIDHPDGLYNPAEYFRRVQERYTELAAIEGVVARDGARQRPLYVVVEKIIAPHEQLPETWPVFGTTGYRFANVVNGLFVDTEAAARVDRAWRAFVRDEADDFAEFAYRSKRLIMRTSLAGELTVLANRLLRIARADRRTRDFTFNTLRQALAEVVACFPVYRTYIAEQVAAQDRRYVDWAVAQAKRRSGDPSIYDFAKSVLLVNPPSGTPPHLEAEYRAFAMRFQQFTAPVTAKGVEDTSLYLFNRLVSLNDVGGDPDSFGMTVSAFHGASADRVARWPHTILATSTHDSKRSEDVRARIDVISEMPAAWRLAVRRWSRINRSKKRSVDDEQAPSRNDEYLLYQTLVGTFPAGDIDAQGLEAYRHRIEEYMLKAAREAKSRTSWINTNEAYETAIREFVRALLGKREGNLFLDDFRSQLAPYVWFGMLNSVAATLIKLASPGVPDVYQGNEIFDYSLVDPDNRRPIDYDLRRRLLGSLRQLAEDAGKALPARVRALFDTPYDGRTKLWVVMRVLAQRTMRPELFAKGDYYPIAVSGARARHTIAFARRLGTSGVIVIAGRLFASLGLEPGVLPVGDVWRDTAAELPFLPPNAQLVNALTGESLTLGPGPLALERALGHFPGALLVYDTPSA